VAKSPAFTIIEVMIGAKDLSPIGVKYICPLQKSPAQNPHLT
jgi:hypothetical protein